MTIRALKYFSYLILGLVLMIASLIIALPFYLQSKHFKLFATEALEEVLNREVVLSGPIELSVFSPLNFKLAGVSIRDLGLKSAEMLKLGELQVEAPLIDNILGRYRIDKVILKDSELSFVSRKDGSSNWSFGSSQETEHTAKSENDQTVIPPIQQLELENVKISLVSQESTQVLDFKSFLASNVGHNRSAKISANLNFRDSLLNLEGELNSLESLIENGAAKIAINIIDKETRAFAAGGIKADFSIYDFDLSLSGSSLSALNSLFGVELPAWTNYDLKTRLKYKVEAQSSLSLNETRLQIEDSDLTGDLFFNFEPFSIEGKLKAETILLANLVPTSRDDSQPTQSTGDGEETIFPISSLTSLIGDIQIEVDKLVGPESLEWREIRLKAKAQGGAFEASNIHAQVLGGELNGRFSASAESIQLEVSANKIKSSEIKNVTGSGTFFEGEFDLVLNVNSNGESLSDLKRNLDGAIVISTEQGELASSGLRAASSGLYGIISPIFGDQRKAELECLYFASEIKRGVIKSKEKVLKLGQAFIFAKGEINLINNSVAYNFNVNSENPSLVSLIPPFRAFGSLDSPYFVPSTSGAVASVVDTAEGIGESAFGLLQRSGRLMLSIDEDKYEGLDLCHRAYKVEEARVSSLVGSALNSLSPEQEDQSN